MECNFKNYNNATCKLEGRKRKQYIFLGQTMKVPSVYENELKFYGTKDIVEEICKFYRKSAFPTTLCRMYLI